MHLPIVQRQTHIHRSAEAGGHAIDRLAGFGTRQQQGMPVDDPLPRRRAENQRRAIAYDTQPVIQRQAFSVEFDRRHANLSRWPIPRRAAFCNNA